MGESDFDPVDVARDALDQLGYNSRDEFGYENGDFNAYFVGDDQQIDDLQIFGPQGISEVDEQPDSGLNIDELMERSSVYGVDGSGAYPAVGLDLDDLDTEREVRNLVRKVDDALRAFHKWESFLRG